MAPNIKIEIQSRAAAINEARRCLFESPVDEKRFTC